MTESETKESVDEVSLSENVRASEPEQINDKAVEADLKVKETPESADSKAADEIELEKPEPIDTPDKPQEETEKSATEADNEPQEKTKEAPVAPNDEEVRPALPKRKTSTQNVHENPILAQLTEAFPGIDAKYVKAVLIASQGALDPAFNALLFLSDPSFEAEATVPTAVPQSSQSGNSRSPTAVSQLQQDEILARQLDAQFNKGHARRGAPRSMDDERRARERRIRERQREFERRTAHGAGPLSPEEQRRYERMEAEDQEDNDFLSQLVDKDLPELREKVGRQVQETGRKVNDWISGFRKNWAQDQSSQQQSSQYPEFSDRQQSQRRDTSSRRSSDSEFEDYTRPEHRTARFNSFGAKVGDDSTTSSAKLASHGISLYNKGDKDVEDESDADIAPQLPSRNKAKDIQPETTYIDTPEAGTRKKWQPLPPEPINVTPSKVNATASKNKRNPDVNDDDFLINTDDEL